MLAYLFFSLALVPLLALRFFTPLFCALLLARWGPPIEALAAIGIGSPGRAPAFMTADAVLVASFLLMCFELAAQRSPRWRGFAGRFETKAKAVAAAGCCLWAAPGGVPELVLALAASVAVGWLVFLAAGVRLSVFGLLAVLDPEDDLGLAGLLGWAEDIFAIFFLALLLLFPALAAAIACCFIPLVFLLRPRLTTRDERRRVPCPRCGAPNTPCATACARCGEAMKDVRRLDPLGFFGSRPAAGLERHRLELLGHRRCPHCGERLEGGSLAQACATCRRRPFATPAEAEAYLAFISARLPRTLLVLSVCSFFPLLGLMPGIFYYRFTLIAALQGYLPESSGAVGLWLPRIFNFLLACLQPLPLLGMLALPMMCLTKFQVYRLLLRREIACQLGIAPPPPAAAAS